MIEALRRWTEFLNPHRQYFFLYALMFWQLMIGLPAKLCDIVILLSQYLLCGLCINNIIFLGGFLLS